MAASARCTRLVTADRVECSDRPGGVTGWLLHFHGPTAYALVGFLAFAEAALLVGFFIPGETAVVIGGVLAGLTGQPRGDDNGGRGLRHRGDSVGFEVGKRAGP